MAVETKVKKGRIRKGKTMPSPNPHTKNSKNYGAGCRSASRKSEGEERVDEELRKEEVLVSD
jgi:hypothetical protein